MSARLRLNPVAVGQIALDELGARRLRDDDLPSDYRICRRCGPHRAAAPRKCCRCSLRRRRREFSSAKLRRSWRACQNKPRAAVRQLLSRLEARRSSAGRAHASGAGVRTLRLCCFEPHCRISISTRRTPHASHRRAAGLVEVDRVRADERAAVIVDDIRSCRADDLEPGPQRKARPIGCRAHVARSG